jgi:hypothetical protein
MWVSPVPTLPGLYFTSSQEPWTLTVPEVYLSISHLPSYALLPPLPSEPSTYTIRKYVSALVIFGVGVTCDGLHNVLWDLVCRPCCGRVDYTMNLDPLRMRRQVLRCQNSCWVGFPWMLFPQGLRPLQLGCVQDSNHALAWWEELGTTTEGEFDVRVISTFGVLA